MPELPDITVYLGALEKRVLGRKLIEVRVTNPFFLRTAVPPLQTAGNREVISLRRLGKRIVLGLENDLWLVLHLMIAGRLHWRDQVTKISGKQYLGAFHFPKAILTVTEAGSKKRASLHLIEGETALRTFDPGGIEVMSCSLGQFAK